MQLLATVERRVKIYAVALCLCIQEDFFRLGTFAIYTGELLLCFLGALRPLTGQLEKHAERVQTGVKVNFIVHKNVHIMVPYGAFHLLEPVDFSLVIAAMSL